MSKVDISFTVKASERNGRTLYRDLNTGQIFWEPAEVPVETEATFVAAPVPSRKPRRSRKDSEGDK